MRKRFLIMMCFVFILTCINVKASIVEPEEIDNNAYVIGTHLFTREKIDDYNGQLTTKLIMLASVTIESEDISDMIIYYKNPRGQWLDALTGQPITDLPANFELVFKNTKVYVDKPKLALKSYFTNDPTLTTKYKEEEGLYEQVVEVSNIATYDYDMGGIEDLYYDLFEVVGEDEYEKVNESTLRIDETVTLKTEPGTIRKFVAKTYLDIGNDEKVNSSYSKEFKVDNVNYDKPEIKLISRDFDVENKFYTYSISVDDESWYCERSSKTCYGKLPYYDVYVKNANGEPQLVPIENEEKRSVLDEALVKVDPGKIAKVVVKKYAYDTNGEKVYSTYSDEVEIGTTSYATPVITLREGNTYREKMQGDKTVASYVYTIDVDKTAYCEELDLVNHTECIYALNELELYEKVNGQYEKREGLFNIHTPNELNVDPNVNTTYVLRGHIKTSDGNDIYTGYSNEISVNTIIATPNLERNEENEFYEYDPETGKGYYVYDGFIDYDDYLADVSNHTFNISGMELYEKTLEDNEKYHLIVDDFMPDETVGFTVGTGETRTYVVRVYSYNQKGDRIYSPYSNEITISKEMVTIPVGELTSTLNEKHNSLNEDGESIIYYTHKFTMDNTSFADRSDIVGLDLFMKDSETPLEVTIVDNHTVLYDIYPNEKVTIVGKLYTVNNSGEKVYGDSSEEEITIDYTDEIETPSITNITEEGAEQLTFKVDLTPYKVDDNFLTIAGYKLYEKDGEDYNLLKTVKLVKENGEWNNTVTFTQEAETQKTYVIVTYVLLRNGEALPSSYSNEITIDNRTPEEPTNPDNPSDPTDPDSGSQNPDEGQNP